MSEKVVEEEDVPNLEIRENFFFPSDFDSIKLMIEWVSKQQGIICDLDVNMYCYDERVSLNILSIVICFMYICCRPDLLRKLIHSTEHPKMRVVSWSAKWSLVMHPKILM